MAVEGESSSWTTSLWRQTESLGHMACLGFTGDQAPVFPCMNWVLCSHLETNKGASSGWEEAGQAGDGKGNAGQPVDILPISHSYHLFPGCAAAT